MSSLTKISLVIAFACLAVSTVSTVENDQATPVLIDPSVSDLAVDVITEEIIEPLETSTCSCAETSKHQSKKSLESKQKSINHLVPNQIKLDDKLFVEKSKPIKATSSAEADLEADESLIDVEAAAKTEQESDALPASASEEEIKEEVKTPEKSKNKKNNVEKDKKFMKKRSKRDAKDKSSKSKSRKGGKDSGKKSKGGKNRK